GRLRAVRGRLAAGRERVGPSRRRAGGAGRIAARVGRYRRRDLPHPLQGVNYLRLTRTSEPPILGLARLNVGGLSNVADMLESRPVQRKLTAILSADVADYSGLMEADEAGTLERLKVNRGRVFDPCVAAHGGRLVKLMGDGALVEFASVIAAVNCAPAIQEATAPAKTE